MIVFQRKCNLCGQNLIHFQITLPENQKNVRAQHQLFLMLNFGHASMFVAKLYSNGKTITKLQLYYNTQQVMLPEMHAWHHNNTAPSTSSPHFHLFYLLQHHSFWITNTLQLIDYFQQNAWCQDTAQPTHEHRYASVFGKFHNNSNTCLVSSKDTTSMPQQPVPEQVGLDLGACVVLIAHRIQCNTQWRAGSGCRKDKIKDYRTITSGARQRGSAFTSLVLRQRQAYTVQQVSVASGGGGEGDHRRLTISPYTEAPLPLNPTSNPSPVNMAGGKSPPHPTSNPSPVSMAGGNSPPHPTNQYGWKVSSPSHLKPSSSQCGWWKVNYLCNCGCRAAKENSQHPFGKQFLFCSQCGIAWSGEEGKWWYFQARVGRSRQETWACHLLALSLSRARLSPEYPRPELTISEGKHVTIISIMLTASQGGLYHKHCAMLNTSAMTLNIVLVCFSFRMSAAMLNRSNSSTVRLEYHI